MGLPLSAGWKLKDYLQGTTFSLAFTIEGSADNDDELPERCVACADIVKFDFNNPLDVNAIPVMK